MGGIQTSQPLFTKLSIILHPPHLQILPNKTTSNLCEQKYKKYTHTEGISATTNYGPQYPSRKRGRRGRLRLTAMDQSITVTIFILVTVFNVLCICKKVQSDLQER